MNLIELYAAGNRHLGREYLRMNGITGYSVIRAWEGPGWNVFADTSNSCGFRETETYRTLHEARNAARRANAAIAIVT